MRKLSFLLCLFALLVSSMVANAAFWVNNKSYAPASTASLEGTDTTAITSNKRDEQTVNFGNSAGVKPDHDTDQKTKPNSLKSGWEGIVALCCLFVGFLVPLAIVFGALGMRPGRKHRGMAKVALILGIVISVVAFAVFLVVAAGH